MTPIADMVERMLANNDPAVAIVAAVRALECVTAVTLSSRDASRSVTQEQARVRALNYRNRKKSQQVAKANDVANTVVMSVTPSRDASRSESTRDLLTSSSLLPEDPLGKDKKERKKEVIARARGTRLCAGSPLTEEYRNIAVELGVAASQIPQIWAEFVDYWCALPGVRGTKLDWLATWRNRVRQVLPKIQNGSQRGRPLTQHQIERQESREILDELQKFVNDGSCSSSDADPGLLRLDTGDGQESFHSGFRRNVVDLPFGGNRKGD